MKLIQTVQPRLAIATSIFLLAITSTPASADADSATDRFHLGEIKCWDLTGIEEESRIPAMLMVFGYVAGVKNLPTHNGVEIPAILEKSAKMCAANPDMYVSTTIERALTN